MKFFGIPQKAGKGGKKRKRNSFWEQRSADGGGDFDVFKKQIYKSPTPPSSHNVTASPYSVNMEEIRKNRIIVFIASPGDLEEEQAIAEQIFSELQSLTDKSPIKQVSKVFFIIRP